MVEKTSRLPSVYILICDLAFFTQFREKLFCMQTTKAQISQRISAVLPIISKKYDMIAKPATCKNFKNKIPVSVRVSRQFQRGGGGGRIASRGRFVPVFLLGNKWQLMIFMGRSGSPCPLCLRPYQSFKQFEFTFYLFFLLGLVNSQNVC